MNIAITTEVQDEAVRAELRRLTEQVEHTWAVIVQRRDRLPVGGDRTAVAGWIDVLDELREALAVALGETPT